jgi:hypothetical protein
MNKRIKKKIHNKNTIKFLIQTVSNNIDDLFLLQSRIESLENSNLDLIQEIKKIKQYIDLTI